MTVFYLKLVITPLLMLAISLAGRRWGPQLGGLLSGLPLTSAVVTLFVSLEQGAQFAWQAVPGALAGLAAIQATYLFYFLFTRKVSAWLGCCAALLFYGCVGWAISQFGGLLLPVLLTLAMLLANLLATRAELPGRNASFVPLPRWVIPMRMATATALLLLITTTAHWLGPVVSGMLAPIPVIAWPLAVFAHVQGGRHELATIVRGNAIGAVGVIGFYLTLHGTLQAWGIGLAVALAVLLAVLVTFVLAKLLNRS
ncbi:hypothetical protein [Pseudomonas cremoricolorata]|uniref:hypothetical protein n=1 Tax=Pseudomonas cremoricolorata TaxID=157783 RepID=UPI0004298D62|nr:hypothetical protein [Pseudomonas cremoricolorata]